MLQCNGKSKKSVMFSNFETIGKFIEIKHAEHVNKIRKKISPNLITRDTSNKH